MSRVSRGWGAGLAVALGAGMGSAAVAAPAAGAAGPSAGSASQVQAPVPTITWGSCHDNLPGVCATAVAPLDYDQPRGRTILLDLRKIPAKQQNRKLGSLFVNPGGPGGSSTGFAPYAALLLGSTVSQRYDVIGVDPRGVGKHSRMLCRNDSPQPPAAQPFPITEAQSRATWRQAEFMRSACTKDPNQITLHMSTADTARDMDLIRQAVGDQKLNYYGISYGTQLGSTYASMFPTRVGRFVVDGVLDPVAWSTGGPGNLPAEKPFSNRLRSAKGAAEALISALQECNRVGARECELAPNADRKWAQLIERARAGKLTFGGERVSYQDLVGGVLGFLYDNNYSGLDSLLQTIWEENLGSGARSAAGGLARLRAAAERVTTAPYTTPAAKVTKVTDAFIGVACADTRNPETRLDWWRAGQEQDKVYPWFGSLWTWASAPCAKYPIITKTDSYFGPYGGRTATPILVVGNRYDPATPIHGARKVASLFTGARLLTYNGWGHGALGTGCATAAYNRYYATGALPAPGAVCQPDLPLWAG